MFRREAFYFLGERCGYKLKILGSPGHGQK